MQWQQKTHTWITFKMCHGFQITCCCVTSIRSTWHWLYNNSLSVLYDLNGSTHLLCDVLLYPVARAVTPWYVLEPDANGTGRMLSETIKTHLNAKHMKEILLHIAHLHHHNVIFSKKFKKFLQLVAPVTTFSRLCWLHVEVSSSYSCVFHSILLFIAVSCKQTVTQSCMPNWFHLKYFINGYKLRTIANCLFNCHLRSPIKWQIILIMSKVLQMKHIVWTGGNL
jgi:hypothetical protein